MMLRPLSRKDDLNSVFGVERTAPPPGFRRAFVDQVANSVANLAATLAVAKVGTIAEFGGFATITTLAFLIGATLSALSFSAAASDIPRLRRARNRYIGSGLALAVPLALVLGACVFLPILSVAAESSATDWLLIQVLSYLLCYYEATRRLTYLASGSIPYGTLVRAVACGLAALLAIGGAVSLSQVLVVLVGSLAVAIAGDVLVFVGMWRGYRQQWVMRLLRKGSPLSLSTLIISGFEQAIIVLAAQVQGAGVVAGWRSANYLYGLLGPLLTTLDVWFPKFLHDRTGRRLHIGKGVALAIAAAALSASAVLGAATYFIWFPFLGDEYRPYGWLSWVYAAVFSTVVVRMCYVTVLRQVQPAWVLYANVLGLALGGAAFALLQADPKGLPVAMLVSNIATTAAVVAATHVLAGPLSPLMTKAPTPQPRVADGVVN